MLRWWRWRPRQGEEKSEPEAREDNKRAEDHELVKTTKQSKTHSHGGSKRPKVQELAITLAPGFPGKGFSHLRNYHQKGVMPDSRDRASPKTVKKNSSEGVFFFFLFIWTRFQHVALLTWNSLCRSGWLHTHRALSAANKVICHHYACVAHCYLLLRQVLTMLSSWTPMLGFKGPSHLSLWKNWD